MSTQQMQTLEVEVGALSNDMLGHLHRLGAEIYARHAKKADVLIFSRPLPAEDALPLLDGALAPPGG